MFWLFRIAAGGSGLKSGSSKSDEGTRYLSGEKHLELSYHPALDFRLSVGASVRLSVGGFVRLESCHAGMRESPFAKRKPPFPSRRPPFAKHARSGSQTPSVAGMTIGARPSFAVGGDLIERPIVKRPNHTLTCIFSRLADDKENQTESNNLGNGAWQKIKHLLGEHCRPCGTLPVYNQAFSALYL